MFFYLITPLVGAIKFGSPVFFVKLIDWLLFLEFNFFQLDIGVVQVEFTHSNKTNIVRIMEAAGARSSRLRIIKEQREEYLEYIFRRILQPLRLERRFSFCQEGEESHLRGCVFRFGRLKACQEEVKVSRIISGPQNDIFVHVNNGKPILLAYALVFAKKMPRKVPNVTKLFMAMNIKNFTTQYMKLKIFSFLKKKS